MRLFRCRFGALMYSLDHFSAKKNQVNEVNSQMGCDVDQLDR